MDRIHELELRVKTLEEAILPKKQERDKHDTVTEKDSTNIFIESPKKKD